MAVKKIVSLNQHQNPATNENQFDIENYLNENWDNIIDVVDNNADELTTAQNNVTTLQNDNTTNKQDIANLKTENEELKAENERLRQDMNAYPSNTAEGEYITLTDSADSRFNKFKIKGNSIQNGEPTPLNQIKIQNVEGNVNVTICNRNIANSNEVYSNMKAFNSQQCSEIIEDEKECIKFDNTSFRPDTLKHFNLINFKFKENTSYTIRGLFKKENQSPSIGLFIQVVYTDGTQDMVDSSANGWIELRLVSNASKTIRNIGFSYSNPGYYYLDKSSIFIGEGNANDYILNQQKKFVFPLEEGQVLRERDYLADDGIHHKRKKIELDGTENWFQHPTSKVFGFSVSDIDVEGAFNSSAKIIVMSNYFKASKYYQLYYGEVDEAISGHDSNQAIEIRATRFATIDNLKTWLAQKKAEGNPVIVEYDLKEEETEAYTDEQKQVYDELAKTAKTYKTVTNIFSTNEISPKFEVNYRRDIDTYIDNKLANVNEQILNIAGGN